MKICASGTGGNDKMLLNNIVSFPEWWEVVKNPPAMQAGGSQALSKILGEGTATCSSSLCLRGHPMMGGAKENHGVTKELTRT